MCLISAATSVCISIWLILDFRSEGLGGGDGGGGWVGDSIVT